MVSAGGVVMGTIVDLVDNFTGFIVILFDGTSSFVVNDNGVIEADVTDVIRGGDDDIPLFIIVDDDKFDVYKKKKFIKIWF